MRTVAIYLVWACTLGAMSTTRVLLAGIIGVCRAAERNVVGGFCSGYHRRLHLELFSLYNNQHNDEVSEFYPRGYRNKESSKQCDSLAKNTNWSVSLGNTHKSTTSSSVHHATSTTNMLQTILIQNCPQYSCSKISSSNECVDWRVVGRRRWCDMSECGLITGEFSIDGQQ